MPKSNTIHVGNNVYITRTSDKLAWRVCRGARTVRIVDNYSFAITLAGQLWQGRTLRRA